MLELNPNHAQSLFMQMHALLLLNRAVEAEGIFSILKVWKDEGKLGFYQSRILDMYAEEFDALAQAETQ
jgi:hypothetical protein